MLPPVIRHSDWALRRMRKCTNRVCIEAVCIGREDNREPGKQVGVMPMIYMGGLADVCVCG